MNELLRTHTARATFQRHLLATASALVLANGMVGAGAWAEENQNGPLVWIELGGQLERQTGQGDVPDLPFVQNFDHSPAFDPVSPMKLERAPLYSNGLEGKILFEPRGSNWVLSAGVRYGRSRTNKDVHRGRLYSKQVHRTAFPQYYYTSSGARKFHVPRTFTRELQAYVFGGTQINQQQSHTVLDFTAGRDVGLGMFGRNASSTLNVGVRFAQFVSKTSSVVHARPDAVFYSPCNAAEAAYFAPYFPSHNFQFCNPRTPAFHTFAASLHSYRKFQGVGPSLSWTGSVPVLGNPDNEALTVDWGMNAAILFGRQHADGSHSTTGDYSGFHSSSHYTRGRSFDRSRRIVVPNIGGLVGASLKFPNAKISLGYRGDFFFGAMDTGVDERKTKTVGFYGPFAVISLGFGG